VTPTTVLTVTIETDHTPEGYRRAVQRLQQAADALKGKSWKRVPQGLQCGNDSADSITTTITVDEWR